MSQNELVPHWHPHQLRDTAAIVIRREMGLDAARALLGHRSLGITDTYAELDQALAVEAARKLGRPSLLANTMPKRQPDFWAMPLRSAMGTGKNAAGAEMRVRAQVLCSKVLTSHPLYAGKNIDSPS